MNRPLFIIYAAVVLNAIGIGLIFPILPSLLRDVTGAQDVAPYIGILAALYAMMQFVFAPVLGALSDRMGRRPILLISVGGSAVDYLFLAFAPHLWMLSIGRAVAGLTGANMSVAAAYITDISADEQRARRFGLLNAMFGAGFIIGPILGGALGDYWLRLPFIAAAALNGINLLLAYFMLPESREASGERIESAALNPLRPLRWALSMKSVMPIILVFFIFAATGESYGVAWALWGYDSFHWNGLWVGLSLGTYGLCQTLAQAFLPGPAVKRLGERTAILTGVACASLALIIMAFSTRTWMVFAVMPVFALGGIGVPALQVMAARQIDESRQGQFQGVIASAVSLASVVAPLTFSSLYFMTQKQWPGAIWLSVVAVYAIGAALVMRLHFKTATPIAAQASRHE